MATGSEMLHLATDVELDSAIQKNPLVLVDFWAEWCYPCKMVAPTLEELAKEYKGKVVFAKVNVDENPESATKFSIFSIPTIILFKNGKQADTIIGVVPKFEFESKIKSHL